MNNFFDELKIFLEKASQPKYTQIQIHWENECWHISMSGHNCAHSSSGMITREDMLRHLVDMLYENASFSPEVPYWEADIDE